MQSQICRKCKNSDTELVATRDREVDSEKTEKTGKVRIKPIARTAILHNSRKRTDQDSERNENPRMSDNEGGKVEAAHNR